MANLIRLNLEDKVHKGLPSGWSDLAKFVGYPLLAASTIIGSENCGGGGGGSPTQPTPTDNGPVRLNGQPTGMLPAGTTEKMASLETRANANCKYATTAGVDYDAMQFTFSTTGEMKHSTLVTGLQNGNSYTLNARCRDAATGATNTTDFPIAFSVAMPSLEFNQNIVNVLNTSQAVPSGKLYVAGLGQNGSELEIPWEGELKVKTEHGLKAGKSYSMRLTAAGYKNRGGEPGNYFTGRVTGTGIEVDLGGGRTEYPLNMIPSSFNEAEYAKWRLQRDNATSRPVRILPIGVMDKFLYNISNAGNTLTRTGNYTIDQRTLNDLLDVLANDTPFWSGGMYPLEQVAPGQVPSYVKMQSRGDNIPDTSARQPGWILIFPESNPGMVNAIDRSDSGGHDITYCFMAFNPNVRVTRTNFTRDLRECLGGREVRPPYYPDDGLGPDSKPLQELRPYFFVAFARPIWHTNPDNVLR